MRYLKMIKIVNAIKKLDKVYPNFHLNARMEDHLNMLSSMLLFHKDSVSWNILPFRSPEALNEPVNYEDIFPKKGFLSDRAYRYFERRLKVFHNLYEKNQKRCLQPATERDLTLLSKVKGESPLTTLINNGDSLYIRVNKYINDKPINLIVNDYCWYFGDWAGIKTKDIKSNSFISTKYAEETGFRYPDEISGYVRELPVALSEFDNTHFFEIDNSCFDTDIDKIYVTKLLINNNNECLIDRINGGILTSREFVEDFYFHLETPIPVEFEDIYILNEVYNRLTAKPNKHEERVMLIKKALESNWLDDIIEKQGGKIISKLTQKSFFSHLSELKNFNQDEKGLFHIDYKEAFKARNKPKINEIIHFESGRKPNETI